MLAHKDGTETFNGLTDAEKAKSISAQILNVEASIDNRVRNTDTTRRKEVADMCIGQVERLLTRLQTKHP